MKNYILTGECEYERRPELRSYSILTNNYHEEDIDILMGDQKELEGFIMITIGDSLLRKFKPREVAELEENIEYLTKELNKAVEENQHYRREIATLYRRTNLKGKEEV